MSILINLLVSALAVFISAYILPGVDVTGLIPALVAAVLLGIMNAFIKPIISIFALPITILTLGLFSLVINGLIVMVVAYFVEGFNVQGFLWAIIFAIVLAIVNGFLNMFTKK
ncbi:MAG: phage holin family protein [Patescibacteria group bacterium]